MLGRLYRWYLHSRATGFAICAASLLYGGWGAAHQINHLGGTGGTLVEPTTIYREQAHTVTVRLPGKVIRRVDHILVVRTPRYVFVFHGHRRVLPPRIVHIRFEVPGGGAPPVIAAVIQPGVPPETVTVPVTVTVPGPTTTVTLPQATTTVTIPITTTVPTTITVPAESSTTP